MLTVRRFLVTTAALLGLALALIFAVDGMEPEEPTTAAANASTTDTEPARGLNKLFVVTLSAVHAADNGGKPQGP